MHKKQTPISLGEARRGQNKKQKQFKFRQYTKINSALQRELARLALIQSRNWGGEVA